MDNTPINLRIKFKKVGDLQYISHLDLVRTMQKIIVRAKLPLWYTEGFNPKPKMVFATPLSIGTESVTEFLDIRLSEHIDPEEAKRRLNENMTDEMQVLEAYYPTLKQTDLKWMSYTITVRTAGADDAVAERCNYALKSEKIEIMKKGKKGETLADIKPLIKSASAVFCRGEIIISCILSADPSAFLNPEHIIKYLRAECGMLSGENLLSEGYSIMRERAFCEDMSEFK